MRNITDTRNNPPPPQLLHTHKTPKILDVTVNSLWVLLYMYVSR